MNVYISSDHGGFELKKRIINELELEKVTIIDLGPFELDPDDDYPDFAFPVAQKVAGEEGSLGILICRSGNGMCIAANKVVGAYAALCFSQIHAQKAREDDNANICCLDADYEGEDPVLIVMEFINAEFTGMHTRHGRRFKKIKTFEANSQ